jgi:hypothetical protein
MPKKGMVGITLNSVTYSAYARECGAVIDQYVKS